MLKQTFICILICICTTAGLLHGEESVFFGPYVESEGIRFRYHIPDARSVAVAGDFNNWRPFYLSHSGERGFEGFLPILLESDTYRYKLIVDGIWQQDHENEAWQHDSMGDKLSLLQVQKTMLAYRQNPQALGNNTYRFYFHDTGAKEVYLSGTFNNFNPYSAGMKRDHTGVWSITVQVFPGRHFYYFLADGQWKLDPEHSETGNNRFGHKFSAFSAR